MKMWRGDLLSDEEIAALKEQFWSRVKKANGNRCWEWIGGRSSQGYGSVPGGGCYIGAHRFSWFLHNGVIPPKLWVLHECDNPPCVRPKHLFLGTRIDNIRDMMMKGRDNHATGADHPMNRRPELRLKGTKNGRALLTDDDVREIRVRVESGEQVAALARETGMSEGALRHIVKRRHWRHVE